MLAAGAIAAVMAAAGPATAHVVSDRDIRVVAQIPSDWAAKAASAVIIDSAGCALPNRSGGWRHVGHQRGAMLVLVDASARADSIKAERAWTALDAAFAQQVQDGSFRVGDPAIGRAADAALTAEWLAGASRALVAVMNGPLQKRFRIRYALMKPKLQRALDHQLTRHDELMTARGGDAAAMFAEASAFLLADGIYHDERYGRAGQQALARALTLQRKDGAYLTDGKAEPQWHARALIMLQGVVIYFPSPTLERSAERAARWLRTKSRGRAAPGQAMDEVGFAIHYAAIRPPAPLGTGH